MKKRIVILGGGFGGLYTALEFERSVARDPEVEVTLVSHDNFFLFTPMLHELAASDLDMTHIVNPIRKLLKRVQLFQGDVKRILLNEMRVEVSHGTDPHHHELEYDQWTIDLLFSKDLVQLTTVRTGSMQQAEKPRTAEARVMEVGA